MRTLNRVPSPQALDPLGSTQSKTGAKFKVPEMGFQRWQFDSHVNWGWEWEPVAAGVGSVLVFLPAR